MRFLVNTFGDSHSCWVGLRPPQGTTGGTLLRINKLSTNFIVQRFCGTMSIEWWKGWILSLEGAATARVCACQIYTLRSLLKQPEFLCYPSFAL